MLNNIPERLTSMLWISSAFALKSDSFQWDLIWRGINLEPFVGEIGSHRQTVVAMSDLTILLDHP